MGRAEKLYRRLDGLELSLEERLARELTACVEGRNDLLFCSREFLPSHYPRYMPTELADKLLDLVEEIRGLRRKMREPFEGTLAWRFRKCCVLWADHCDPHRGSAQTIARRLLLEIGPRL
jgi:hypothetical protein